MSVDGDLERLIAAAKLAASRAYCPYSRFPVGAALLADNGAIISGCNVENASSGLTICAERSAIFQGIAIGQRRFVRAVVFTPTPTPTAPCGACRQVLNEFAPEIIVTCVCDGPERIECRLSDLLPHAFGPANLAPRTERSREDS